MLVPPCPLRAEASVGKALQALDARRLVASQEQALAHARDGRQVLVQRVLDMAQRPPIGKGERHMAEAFGVVRKGHGGNSLCDGRQRPGEPKRSALASIDPDDLTVRGALEALYRLKAAADAASRGSSS